MPIIYDGGQVIKGTTRWYNPTPYVRKVRIHMETGWTTVKWEPEEIIEIPSMYDRAIQIVICEADECNGRGPNVTSEGLPRIKCQPCIRGHKGFIMGGQDPLLVRLDKGDVKNTSLDPDEVERQKVKDEARKIALNQKAIREALLEANQELAATGTPAPGPGKHKKPPQGQPHAET